MKGKRRRNRKHRYRIRIGAPAGFSHLAPRPEGRQYSTQDSDDDAFAGARNAQAKLKNYQGSRFY